MIIKKFVFSVFQENTYIIWDDKSHNAAVIDPGCYLHEEEKILSDYISENELCVKYLLNTHCHIDHIFGNNFVFNKYKPEFIAPEYDKPLLEAGLKQAEMFNLKLNESPSPDRYFVEGEEIVLASLSISPIFTPGHTPGEFSLYIKSEKICVTGDVLFLEGIGRTDLWGGNYEQLLNSIKFKLFTLPGETIIYPGHGDKSTIGYEMNHNPFMI